MSRSVDVIVPVHNCCAVARSRLGGSRTQTPDDTVIVSDNGSPARRPSQGTPIQMRESPSIAARTRRRADVLANIEVRRPYVGGRLGSLG